MSTISGSIFIKKDEKLNLTQNNFVEILLKHENAKYIVNKDELLGISKRKKFPNQYTLQLRLLDERTIKFKLGKTGSILLPGCLNHHDVKWCTELICDTLKDILQLSQPLHYIYQIDLIRSNFNLNFNIDLEKLSELLYEKYHHILNISSNLDNYNGVKFTWVAPFCNKSKKKEKHVTFTLFRTGNGSIVCDKDFENVKKSFDFLCDILKDIYQDIYAQSII